MPLAPLLLLALLVSWSAAAEELPDTGISGVYEAMVGSDDAAPLLAYFGEFGFRVVAEAALSKEEAQQVYGVPSALRSYRLQNGAIDSHGLLRILEWRELQGLGVGYAPPGTIGQRMMAIRTRDVIRLEDVFSDLRGKAHQPWLLAGPVFEDIYGLTAGGLSIQSRRVGVREMAVYGQLFSHVFFQRYGYQIPGYGTIGDHSPLQTSEITHHDFLASGDVEEISAYYSQVLGLRAERDAIIDGDWSVGAGAVFAMEPGESHRSMNFASPNNVCGKIKVFLPIDPAYVRDRSERQKVGQAGLTLHSYYTKKLAMVRRLAVEHGLSPSPISENEFGEQSFILTGPDKISWQLLEPGRIRNTQVREFHTVPANN